MSQSNEALAAEPVEQEQEEQQQPEPRGLMEQGDRKILFHMKQLNNRETSHI